MNYYKAYAPNGAKLWQLRVAVAVNIPPTAKSKKPIAKKSHSDDTFVENKQQKNKLRRSDTMIINNNI